MAAWTVPRLLVLVQLLIISGGVVSVRAQVNKSIRSYKVIEDTKVYRYPTEKSEQIALIPSGTTVHVVASQFGQWARIQSQQGRPSGYIKKSSLTITESGSSESTETPNEFRPNPQASSSRSTESRFKTPIEFNNRLPFPVALYWVDFQGNETSFGDLNPGSSRVIQTFATHVWRVRDKSGQLLKSVVVEARPEFVAIDTPAPRIQSPAKPPPPQTQPPPQKASQPPPVEACPENFFELTPGKEIVVLWGNRPGCMVKWIDYSGTVEEFITYPSGRTQKRIVRPDAGEFMYRETPISLRIKAITPASVKFLAQSPVPAQSPPPRLPQQAQAQPRRQPLPGLPGIPMPAQTTSGFTTDNYLTVALAVIIGCGLLYGLILAIKTPSPFVIGHWSTLIENFQASPKEFYVSVESAIARRQVPDINKARVDWKEGGLLTAFREYLRISREKLVLDICAAPYGTGFFVSWWLADLRPSAIGPTLVMIVIVFLLWNYLASFFGLVAGSLYTLIGLILIVLLLGILANRSSGASWVRYVLVIPLIGWMIERFFLPPTYYRMDTASMFKASIEQSVKEVLDQMLQAKGLRALTELELKPIMRDFFQR